MPSRKEPVHESLNSKGEDAGLLLATLVRGIWQGPLWFSQEDTAGLDMRPLKVEPRYQGNLRVKIDGNQKKQTNTKTKTTKFWMERRKYTKHPPFSERGTGSQQISRCQEARGEGWRQKSFL